MNQALDVMVSGMRDVSCGIREFSLSRAYGQAFPVPSAGSHVVLSLPLHERLPRNPYSLLGDPAQRAVWRIAVRRQEASRGGSAWRGITGAQRQTPDGARLAATAGDPGAARYRGAVTVPRRCLWAVLVADGELLHHDL
jgi:ferredoxin-NADP reductase